MPDFDFLAAAAFIWLPSHLQCVTAPRVPLCYLGLTCALLWSSSPISATPYLLGCSWIGCDGIDRLGAQKPAARVRGRECCAKGCTKLYHCASCKYSTEHWSPGLGPRSARVTVQITSTQYWGRWQIYCKKGKNSAAGKEIDNNNNKNNNNNNKKKKLFSQKVISKGPLN